MQRRPGLSHWATVQLPVKGSVPNCSLQIGGSLDVKELKDRAPQLEAQDPMIKRVLMWSEPALGEFMWSQSEPFLQSGCMEVIWVHLGVQTGYAVNTQLLAACGELLTLLARRGHEFGADISAFCF